MSARPMSITLTPRQTNCPQCRAELAIQSAELGQEVICAACHHRFVPQWLTLVTRMSRMAITSLALAVFSLLGSCLTGFPAIALGILALSDIQRSRGRITGTKTAISGIVTGAILSSIYVPVWIALAFPLAQMIQRSTRSATISSAPAVPPIVEDEPHTLDNRLTVRVQPVRAAKSVAIAVLYGIGGDHDPEGQSGLAHLIEHLYVTAAAGTAPVRTADEFMRQYPQGWNAQTFDRFTVIATVFPKESLDKELAEAAARMAELQVTDDDLNREKPRLVQEVQNMFHGFPQLVAYNHARERIRPAPRGGRKGGMPEQVETISLDAIEERLRDYYKPANAVLVVVGDVDEAEVQAAIEKHFGGLLVGKSIPAPADPGAPKFSSDIEYVTATGAPLQNTGAELCVAYPALSKDDELYAAYLVFMARLETRTLQLRVGPNRSPLDFSATIDTSTVLIPIPVQANETAEQAVSRVDNFLAGAVDAKLGPQELIIAKNRFAIELHTTQLPDASLASNLYFVALATGRRAMLGLDSIDFAKAIDGVTNEQVARVGKTVFSRDRRVVVATKNAGSP
jgi:zinc protease